MIGNIAAFNDEILRQRRRELGHLPIPASIPRVKLAGATQISDLVDRGVRIPYVGRQTVRGFTFRGTLFVDTSGWGSDSEPALSFRQQPAAILRVVDEWRERGFTLYWGLVEVGQFQGVLGYWTHKGA